METNPINYDIELDEKISDKMREILEKYKILNQKLDQTNTDNCETHKNEQNPNEGKVVFRSEGVTISEGETISVETQYGKDKSKLLRDFSIEANNLIFQNSKYLHNVFVETMNMAKIKDCINFYDPDYKTTLLNYAKDKINIYQDDSIDLYKVLLKGYSGICINSCATAIYLPKHIKTICINAEFKIDLDDSSKIDLEKMLDESKLIPIPETEFHKKYKKIVLMKPFIPKYVQVTYDSPEIFYYEAYVSSSTELNVDIIKRYIKDKKSNNNDCYPSYDRFVRSINNNIDTTLEELGYRRQVYWANYINQYFIEYINPEYIDFSGLAFSDETMYEDFNKNYREMFNDIDQRLYTNEFDIMKKHVHKHNDQISGMFLVDREDYNTEILNAFDSIYNLPF